MTRLATVEETLDKIAMLRMADQAGRLLTTDSSIELAKQAGTLMAKLGASVAGTVLKKTIKPGAVLNVKGTRLPTIAPSTPTVPPGMRGQAAAANLPELPSLSVTELGRNIRQTGAGQPLRGPVTRALHGAPAPSGLRPPTSHTSGVGTGTVPPPHPGAGLAPPGKVTSPAAFSKTQLPTSDQLISEQVAGMKKTPAGAGQATGISTPGGAARQAARPAPDVPKLHEGANLQEYRNLQALDQSHPMPGYSRAAEYAATGSAPGAYTPPKGQPAKVAPADATPSSPMGKAPQQYPAGQVQPPAAAPPAYTPQPTPVAQPYGRVAPPGTGPGIPRQGQYQPGQLKGQQTVMMGPEAKGQMNLRKAEHEAAGRAQKAEAKAEAKARAKEEAGIEKALAKERGAAPGAPGQVAQGPAATQAPSAAGGAASAAPEAPTKSHWKAKALGLGALGLGAYGLTKAAPAAMRLLEQGGGGSMAYGGGWSPVPYGYGYSPYGAGQMAPTA